MRVLPDSVMVWNETQRAEAVELHGVPHERVTVTGAQTFDRWFGRCPSTRPDEFRRKVGLPPDRPFVLYVGSTSNIARAGVEEKFVRRWLEALQASPYPELADLTVLVRPHPERPGRWYDRSVGPGEVRLWPPEAPEDISNVTGESQRDYFDSLYHSVAVVGINTSALLEAAILGRPVLSIRSRDLVEAHRGTLHFDYLLPENGGFLHMADNFEEHATQLAEAVRAPERSRAQNADFVEHFIRPNGVQSPCTPQLADAVERLAESELSGPAASAAIRYPLRGLMRLYVELEQRRGEGEDAAARRRQAQRAAKERGRRLLDPKRRGDHRIPARYRGRDLSD
jgi:hypothetical protein